MAVANTASELLRLLDDGRATIIHVGPMVSLYQFETLCLRPRSAKLTIVCDTSDLVIPNLHVGTDVRLVGCCAMSVENHARAIFEKCDIGWFRNSGIADILECMVGDLEASGSSTNVRGSSITGSIRCQATCTFFNTSLLINRLMTNDKTLFSNCQIGVSGLSWLQRLFRPTYLLPPGTYIGCTYGGFRVRAFR